tara:strand:- start:955 stop:1266 length:312 start_codon:yes stop_codon:yes gene_type:complete
MTQSFSLSINNSVVGHGSLEDINVVLAAIQKLNSAKERYVGGGDGYMIHETESTEFQFKIETCDVLTFSQMEDAVEATKQREAEEKRRATAGSESDSLETARS